MTWGGGVKKITARIMPDMLGAKIGTKRVPVRALNTPTSSKCTAFQGEAIRDDRRSPNPVFGVEAVGFRVDVFGLFIFVFFWCP